MDHTNIILYFTLSLFIFILSFFFFYGAYKGSRNLPTPNGHVESEAQAPILLTSAVMNSSSSMVKLMIVKDDKFMMGEVGNSPRRWCLVGKKRPG